MAVSAERKNRLRKPLTPPELSPGPSDERFAPPPDEPPLPDPPPGLPAPPFPDAFDPKPSPLGVGFTGMACSEPRLIELAYAFEQATKRRTPPPSAP